MLLGQIAWVTRIKQSQQIFLIWQSSIACYLELYIGQYEAPLQGHSRLGESKNLKKKKAGYKQILKTTV